MTSAKLYPDNNVTFNAQVVDGDVDMHDPMVTLTGYIPQSMVVSSEAALRHRCKVQSDLRHIYHKTIDDFKENSKKYYTKTKEGFSSAQINQMIDRELKLFFNFVGALGPLDKLSDTQAERESDDVWTLPHITETIIRGILQKRCHYVGFAAGETRQRLPARDPVMPHDRLKNNHIAVNRGGNVSVHASEQIDTGDYVVVDFDWKDFYNAWKGNDESGGSASDQAPMKLRVKGFKKCAENCLQNAVLLKGDHDLEAAKKIHCIIQGVETLGKFEMKLPDVVKTYAGLAPRVIGQCKSGCVGTDKGAHPQSRIIDVKLESHIDKRSFNAISRESHLYEELGDTHFITAKFIKYYDVNDTTRLSHFSKLFFYLKDTSEADEQIKQQMLLIQDHRARLEQTHVKNNTFLTQFYENAILMNQELIAAIEAAKLSIKAGEGGKWIFVDSKIIPDEWQKIRDTYGPTSRITGAGGKDTQQAARDNTSSIVDALQAQSDMATTMATTMATASTTAAPAKPKKQKKLTAAPK